MRACALSPAGYTRASFSPLPVDFGVSAGRHVVTALVSSAACGKVTVLSRRELPPESWPAAFPGVDVEKAATKLKVKLVDYSTLATSADFKGHHVGFCLLGTSPFSKLVDFDYTAAFAAKASRVHWQGVPWQ